MVSETIPLIPPEGTVQRRLPWRAVSSFITTNQRPGYGMVLVIVYDGERKVARVEDEVTRQRGRQVMRRFSPIIAAALFVLLMLSSACGGEEPPVAPTPPASPAATPEPTATRQPPVTVEPTQLPTAAPAAIPTATVPPQETPTPTSTPTPTPAPIPTPEPTATPKPTATPTPTPTRGAGAGEPKSMPPNFKVAFIGDQGLGRGSRAVLEMIRGEGADMVLHSGDFDYRDSPDLWDEQINRILGDDFPYFASIGNHDVPAWEDYQRKLQERLARISGARCTGDLGVNSFCTYKGLFFVLSGVGTIDSGRVSFIREALASEEAKESLWRICSWHKNQRLMQVGGKGDSVGWEPYEECRKGGAIIATGHEHSYSRTHLMDSFETQSIASKSAALHIDLETGPESPDLEVELRQ